MVIIFPLNEKSYVTQEGHQTSIEGWHHIKSMTSRLLGFVNIVRGRCIKRSDQLKLNLLRIKLKIKIKRGWNLKWKKLYLPQGNED